MSACTLGVSASCFTCAQLKAGDSQARGGRVMSTCTLGASASCYHPLSSMLKILKQEVGEGQFYRSVFTLGTRANWVYQQVVSHAQLHVGDSQASGG